MSHKKRNAQTHTHTHTQTDRQTDRRKRRPIELLAAAKKNLNVDGDTIVPYGYGTYL